MNNRFLIFHPLLTNVPEVCSSVETISSASGIVNKMRFHLNEINTVNIIKISRKMPNMKQ